MEEQTEDIPGKGCCGTTTDDEFWPGPGIIKNNSEYGNYVVASRRIEEGELICEEVPLLESPYGPLDRLPFCLNCYKDLAYSEKCVRCKWPLCENGTCEDVSTNE